jgi:aryl-alcohol dehydrogenase-like predicted oxidoreductase
MDWVRNGSSNLTAAEIVQACDDSLQRLRTDYIDLYQIHWPNRNVPMFGALYFDPTKDQAQSAMQEQLEGMARLIKAGKVRHIGLSNETPWGVSEFVHEAERNGLPRIVTVQNPYALTSRALDNGLDETLYRCGVSLLAYSPLAFGALTGKYDEVGVSSTVQPGRIAIFDSVKKQRWGRPEALAAARRYNALARNNGLTPTQMALAFCYTNWRVASTIIGVTSIAQLDENLAAWGTELTPPLRAEIDAIRWTMRDPAQ